MPRQVPPVKFAAILSLFMLMPSNPSNPFLFGDNTLKDLWRRIHTPEVPPSHPWSYQTHLAEDTWDVYPGDGTLSEVMSQKSQERVRDLINSKKYETVACIGEITGVDLENAELGPQLYERQII